MVDKAMVQRTVHSNFPRALKSGVEPLHSKARFARESSSPIRRSVFADSFFFL
jgi:hypothetical protein